MAKKRPSLKDYLSTGDVVVGEESAAAEAEKEKEAEEAKKKAEKPKKSPAKKKSATEGEKKPAARAKKTTARAKKPAAGKAAGGLSVDEAGLLEMLAPGDRPMWEKLFAAAETEFLPLDLVERREDFRTMPRDRFTLFRLEEAGKTLFHVRTSVQIREPLVCLIKWDETGKISVFR